MSKIEKLLKNIAKSNGLEAVKRLADDGKNIMAMYSTCGLTINVYYNQRYAQASIVGRGIKKARSVRYVSATLDTLMQRVEKSLVAAKVYKERAYN